ncbi:type VI secretion system tube protein TssD [Rapidithrix thailandica]|uniref:Type VI secretion system tube protein TssD n=1 Tax=Rapidithrix thailandica TaxID=413964 RepID=A0AAW9S757_9BACT
MSLIAKLYVEDKVVNILDFKFRFTRSVDEHGKPMGKPNGTIFDITFETTSDQSFFAWSVGMDMVKKVKIVVSPVTQDSKSRVFELYDVHCVFFKNHFNGVNGEPMTTQVKLSPAILYDGGVKILEHYWKETDLSVKTEPTPLTDSYDNLTAGAGNILGPAVEDSEVEKKEEEREKDPYGGLVIVGDEAYQNGVLDVIYTLASKSKTGRKLLKEAIESDFLLVITAFPNENNEVGKRTGPKARMIFNLDAKQELEPSNARGGTARLEHPLYISMAHELNHFIDYCNGKEYKDFINTDKPIREQYDSDTGITNYIANTVPGSETNAVHYENIVRAESGFGEDKLRTHYYGVYVFNRKVSNQEKTFTKKIKRYGRIQTIGRNGYLLTPTKPYDYMKEAENNTVLSLENNLQNGENKTSEVGLWFEHSGIKLAKYKTNKTFGFRGEDITNEKHGYLRLYSKIK